MVCFIVDTNIILIINILNTIIFNYKKYNKNHYKIVRFLFCFIVQLLH